ncbi:hypothetical protein ACCS61_32365 [Rhizobium ruizarguesonis]
MNAEAVSDCTRGGTRTVDPPILADALEDAGFAVLEAGSVLEAIGILGLRTDVDAIFTDVDMPGGLNGVDLAKMLASVNPAHRDRRNVGEGGH